MHKAKALGLTKNILHEQSHHNISMVMFWILILQFKISILHDLLNKIYIYIYELCGLTYLLWCWYLKYITFFHSLISNFLLWCVMFKVHHELCFEYHSFFWQINIFSFSMPFSVSSLRQLHLVPLAIVAIVSTK